MSGDSKQQSGTARSRRTSRLLAQAATLPSVESSLDEFIARANETLLDASMFDSAASLRAEEDKRKESEELRRLAAEQQLRESAAREQSLRRQLDSVQGQLAEAEARTAVASTGGSQDGVIADLKLRLMAADERVRSVEDNARDIEERASKLAEELAVAKTAAVAGTQPSTRERLAPHDADELAQRLRVAEDKVAKAIAAAKAAAMGLTVNPADIAAIESGVSIPTKPLKNRTNWALAFASLIVGGAVAFAAFTLLDKDSPQPGGNAHATPTEPAPQAPAAERGHATVAPTVTPIEEPTGAVQRTPGLPAAAATIPASVDANVAPPAAKPVAVDSTRAASATNAVPAAPEAARVEHPDADVVEPEAWAGTTDDVERSAPLHAAKKRAPTKPKTSAAPSGGLADPFGDASAPEKPKAPEKPAPNKQPSGGLVDPF